MLVKLVFKGLSKFDRLVDLNLTVLILQLFKKKKQERNTATNDFQIFKPNLFRNISSEITSDEIQYENNMEIILENKKHLQPKNSKCCLLKSFKNNLKRRFLKLFHFNESEWNSNTIFSFTNNSYEYTPYFSSISRSKYEIIIKRS